VVILEQAEHATVTATRAGAAERAAALAPQVTASLSGG